MKQIPVIVVIATVGLLSSFTVFAQNAASGSSASWKAIAGTTIYDSETVFRDGITPSSLMNRSKVFSNTAQTNENYGSWESSSYGEVTSSRDLRVYSKTSIDDRGRAHELPSRIFSDASAYLGDVWRADSPILSAGSSFPAFASVRWDGQMIMRVPNPLTTPSLGTSPNFSEVGVSVGYTVFVFDDNYPDSEPFPILNYHSDYLILRADGKNQNDVDFLTGLPYFDTTVYLTDPSNPGSSTTTTLDISGRAMSGLNPGEYGFDVDIGGNLIPFTATVGERYLVNFGIGVYSNVTGAEGSAEANFLNTGTVSFEAANPSEASFTPIVIPEPSSLALVLLTLAAILAVGIHRRRGMSQRGQ